MMDMILKMDKMNIIFMMDKMVMMDMRDWGQDSWLKKPVHFSWVQGFSSQSTGCLKIKNWVLPNCKFAYWSPFCYRQPVSENYIFGRFLLRQSGIKSCLWEKMSPQDRILVRLFGTIFSSKFITKIGCCGAKFPPNMTWGRLVFVRKDQKHFLDTGGPQQGGSPICKFCKCSIR